MIIHEGSFFTMFLTFQQLMQAFLRFVQALTARNLLLLYQKLVPGTIMTPVSSIALKANVTLSKSYGYFAHTNIPPLLGATSQPIDIKPVH